jgi:hypothetical protein
MEIIKVAYGTTQNGDRVNDFSLRIKNNVEMERFTTLIFR